MCLENIVNSNSQILGASEIAGVYEFEIEGVEHTLKVKVHKNCEGSFTGIANLEVQGKDCAGPYRSIHQQSTKERAVRDAVNGFFSFFSEDAKVTVVEDW